MTEPATAKSELRELLTFRAGAQDFCIDIMMVREIRGWTPATLLLPVLQEVPGTAPGRAGVLPTGGAGIGISTTRRHRSSSTPSRQEFKFPGSRVFRNPVPFSGTNSW